jgi:hypothetical protein
MDFHLSLLRKKEDAWNKLRTFESLIRRLDQCENRGIALCKGRIEMLTQKQIHLSRRATAISSGIVKRIPIVLSEALSGRYHRFSDSFYSIGRDLVG